MSIGRIDISWSLEDTIEQLENVASIPPKQRHTDLGELVKTIVAHAYDKGLEAPYLERIVRILTSPASSRYIDQGSITSLVKNLYPSPGSLVSSRTITRIVASFGPGKTTKPSPTVQFLLLRWLVLIHDNGLETRGTVGSSEKMVEDPSYIARLYSALFDNLDMLTLRRPLCHLLALITQRRHVTPARVRVLMALVREASGDEEKAMLELFRIYKSYYPDLIILPFDNTAAAIGRGKGMYLFKHPDVEWARHVLELRRARDHGVTRQSQQQQQPPSSSTATVASEKPTKRRRIEIVIPSLKTSYLSSPNFASLEELRDAKEFARRFGRIEVPNQVVAALGDPLAQRYVQLTRHAKPEIIDRLETWLDAFFTDQLDILEMEGSDEEVGDLQIVLQALLGYTRFMKVLPNAAAKFFRRYLPMWNGTVNRDVVFDLLEYIPPDGFDTLFNSYFRPLERAVLDGSTESKIVLLKYYGSLLRRWTVLLRSSTTNDIPILKVAEHAEILALVILESPAAASDDDTTKQSSPSLSVLDFYGILAHLYAQTSTLPNIADQMTIPPTPTPYLFTLTPTLTHVASMAAIAALYKQTFENLIAAKIAYPPSVIAQFNGYVMDACNLLWRNRALNTQDSNARGCLLPQTSFEKLGKYVKNATKGREGPDQYQLTAAFSLSRNFALSGVAAACVRGSQKEGRLEWQEFRPMILDWLDQRGVEGIGRLMRISMKALRK